ncbi:hypothetical protein ZIOFF_032196 [Zingiber officinale]|uniref:Core Histone H2A/H2B/H3 domain-containing protein n=1 Tax=Zingiber officinale TaxID=94328 RepID=A0A8J5GFY1_ZINOF|nr:hypothetical protein ZIOFF_032196 [Zingiber officinale]
MSCWVAPPRHLLLIPTSLPRRLRSSIVVTWFPDVAFLHRCASHLDLFECYQTISVYCHAKSKKSEAEKKPVEKNLVAFDKPVDEKKATAKKAPIEKEPKASKRLPSKDNAAARDKKRKTKKKGTETYKIYIFKVPKQVHPDIGISMAMSIMNSFINEKFKKFTQEASRLAHYNKKSTITSREIQTSIRLVLPGNSPSAWSPRAPKS